MKKKYALYLLIFFIIAGVTIFFGLTKAGNTEQNYNSYYSTSNKPIFYGASKVTIATNSDFNIRDARFRVFANDFEDGDLTSSIEVISNTLDITTPGNYKVTYKVKDSHLNETTFEQDIVVADSLTKINVERILYTIPSVNNMDKAGFSRSNYADRQILGVYLPAGSSIKARVLSSDLNITIQYFNNDSYTEGSTTTINKNGDWVTIKNEKDSTSYASVPLINTNVLSKDANSINKTLKIELEYDNDIPRLDYYHYKDDQTSFIDNWTTNEYAIIDSERILLVVPLVDKSYMYGYYANGFDSLDKFFDYYNTVINKYDEFIGLKLDSSTEYDQNVRTKYLVKANAHGAGAAYYSVNHVATNSPYVRAFFEKNWGGLHEIAHGYQGSLGGNNDMSLGEVSNNILGHYIQIDKTIYTASGDWLGLLPNIEVAENVDRLAGKKYTELELRTRLYMLINLLDYFEGPQTYSKMFSWYRKQMLLGRTMTNQDAYVESIAEIYGVNIIPYMESWGLTISDSLKNTIYEKHLKLLNILGDQITSSTNLTSFMSSNSIDRKYSLVSNSLLISSNLKSSVTINISIDDISKLSGKKLYLKDGYNIVKEAVINNNTINLTDVSLGTYMLEMPVVDNYTSDYMYVTVKDTTNTITYSYTKVSDVDYGNYIGIKLQGIYNTYGYEILFKDNYNKATIKLGGANMGNSDPYVKIYDASNNLVSDEVVTGLYFDYSKGTFDINLGDGYTIEVNHPNTSKVYIYNALSNSEVTSLKPTSSITRYVIDNGNLRLESMTSSEGEALSYSSLKPYLVSVIEDYKSTATDAELNNKNTNYKTKSSVISAYNKLSSEDKKEYTSFITRIKEGGNPTFTYVGDNYYEVNTNIDLYSLITVFDNEDNDITPSSSNTTITSNLDITKAGRYNVLYEVTDSDNNKSSYNLEIHFYDFSLKEIKKNEYKIEASYSLFEDGSVYLDDNLLSSDKYSVREGSIIITLNEDFYNSLPAGNHTLKVVLNNDEEISRVINVSTPINNSNNPQTGDNLLIYLIVFIFVVMGLLILSEKKILD